MPGTNLFTPISSTCWIALTEEIFNSSGDQFAMFAKCLGTPPTTANVFEHGCIMNQIDSGNGVNALYQNTGTSASPTWTVLDTTVPIVSATKLVDTNGLTALDVGTTASAVNNIRVTDAATGGAPLLSAVGTDTNIGLTLSPKGSGKVSITGTGGKTSTQVFNYIATESGANNAIAGALTDSTGANVALAAGLRVVVKLGHTLQAGANTFNLNGGGAVNIKSHLNVANNIGTAYAATGVIDLFYDGTEWLDMSQ